MIIRQTVGAEDFIIVVRTHYIDSRIESFAARLQHGTGYQICFVVDETERGSAATYSTIPTIRITTEWILSRGLIEFDKVCWRCGDYSLYAAAEIFPEAKFFWLIEPDVVVNFTPLSDFFLIYDRAPSKSFLAAHLLRVTDSGWAWYDTIAPHVVETYKCLFPLVRVERHAIIRMLSARRTIAKKLVSDSSDVLKLWPNDEAFTASIIVNGGLTFGDLNDNQEVYKGSTFYWGRSPISQAWIDSRPSDNLLYHPVISGPAYMERLIHLASDEWYAGCCPDQIRDVHLSSERLALIRIECGQDGQTMYLDEIKTILAR